MLPIEGILTVHHPGMRGMAQPGGAVRQRPGDGKIGGGREFHRRYSREVPSCRMAAEATTRSPPTTLCAIPPQVPTRMRVWAPHLTSSSTQMAVDGPPIPWEITSIRRPARFPAQEVYSRLQATGSGLSSRRAMLSTRPGSPVSRT